MSKHHIHYDFSKNVAVIFTDGEQLVLEDIQDIILSDTGHVLSFKDYYGTEVMSINMDKIKYWRPD